MNKPAGTSADDVLLAAITGQTLPTISAPVGWSLVRSDANGAELRQSIFVRAAGGSEPASYTFTFSAAGQLGDRRDHSPIPGSTR